MYEYRISLQDAALPLRENQMNQLGALGWELVAIAPQIDFDNGQITHNQLVFKRKKG